MQVNFELLNALGLTFIREKSGIAEYRLNSNGLKILLSVNHAKPVVTVMPVYKVGSRNEAVGFTGATHILEHMMFKGVEDGRTGEVYTFPERFRPLGGVWNATTWFDRTNYFETVPARHLELCIATESDRMRRLLLKEEEKATEMTVVRNELERGENDPTRVLLQKLYARAFSEHPYHHPTIGWTTDVEAISIERLKAFYDEYYWPNNTTLLIMGDFDPAQALAWVVKYYGEHPSSPKPIPQVHTVEPRQEGENRFEIRRVGDSPRVAIGFHVPQATHPDNHALAALATVLGGGRKTSRLYQALVEKKLAASVFTWHFQQRDPGMFMVFATPARGVAHDTVEKAILAEIEKLAQEPVSGGELKRAQVSNRKQADLQAADPMVLANRLGEAESVADWTFYANYSDTLDAVTAADVLRVAGTYFDRDNRTVGYFVPKAKAQATKPAAAKPATTIGATASTFAARTTRNVLGNGLTLLVMPEPGTGNVGLSVRLKAGAYYARDEKPLVASLAARQLTAGTKTRTARQISEQTEEMGTALGFNAGNFAVTTSSQVASGDFKSMLELVADVLRNPIFPDAELDTLKPQWANWFSEQMSDVDAMGEGTLVRALYPRDHVFYDKSSEDCLTELESISADDLRAFHAACYTPKGTILSVVGDVEVDAVVALVESLFGDWQGEEPKALVVDVPELPAEPRRINVHIPDKRNASIYIGHPSTIRRGTEDFVAARIANAALGGGFTSRLTKVVRMQNGLTYGIGSSFRDPNVAGSPFVIQLTVNPDNVERALALVSDVVGGMLKDGISKEELAAEVGYAAGTFEVQLRRSDAVASTMADFEMAGLGLSALDTYAASLEALTVDAVNAAIRKYVHPQSFVTVVAGTLPGGDAGR